MVLILRPNHIDRSCFGSKLNGLAVGLVFMSSSWSWQCNFTVQSNLSTTVSHGE